MKIKGVLRMLKTVFPTIDRESSALGFGCMRLPTLENGAINEELAISMIRKGIDRGVRYIDTAYPYHGGESERVVGKALQDGYREKVILATKLPCWQVKTHEDMMRILDEQLEKLQTDHVDFYLLHALGKDRYHQMKELVYQEFFSSLKTASMFWSSLTRLSVRAKSVILPSLSMMTILSLMRFSMIMTGKCARCR